MTGKKGNKIKKEHIRDKRTRANSIVGTKKDSYEDEDEKIDKLTTEIKLLIIFGISVVLFVGVLGGGKGPLIFIGGFLFGLFGILGYIFPLALFVLYTFILANDNSRKIRIKCFGFVSLFFAINSLIYLMSSDMEKPYNLADIYLTAIKTRAGGGVFGSLLSGVLYHLFGKAVSAFILFVFIIISLVLLTQKSFVKGVKRSGNKIYKNTLSNFYRRKEEFETKNKNEVSEEELAKKADIFNIGNRFDLYKPFSDDRPNHQKVENLNNAIKQKIQYGMKEIELESQSPKVVVEKPYFDDVSDNNALSYDVSDTKNEKTDRHNIQIQSDCSLSEIHISEKRIENKENKEEDNSGTKDSFNTIEYNNLIKKTEGFEEKAVDNKNEISQVQDMIRDDIVDDEKENEIEFEEIVLKPDAVEEVKAVESIRKKERPDFVGKMEGVLSQEKKSKYKLPCLELLNKGKQRESDAFDTEAVKQKLSDTFKSFNIDVTMSGISIGPTVTRYELTPAPGVKVSKIQALSDDIKLALAAADIRIEAPIPGKSAVGIEVPNSENSTVMLRDLLEDTAFQTSKCKIPFAVGKDLANRTIVEDIAKMPHLLIAGATGSGKSVCINTLIMSILYKASPEEVKLIMVDPKVVELSIYNGIPHLLTPIVTDAKKAAGALNWAVAEMSKRYQLFANAGVRDLSGYNRWIKDSANKEAVEEQGLTILPQIIIIVDELADLMMVSAKEAEEAICRLAQLARAAGMHLILATQRPSVNVITGLIKANMPSRIAFSVTSGVDSRTILDMNGAEKLLGKGDMLFGPQWLQKPIRLQGAFVSDEEVDAVVSYLKEQAEAIKTSEEEETSNIDEEINQAMNSSLLSGIDNEASDELDPLFEDAARLVIDKEKASIGMLQRALKIGFNRAGRIMDQMEAEGIVGSDEGTKPRTVLMDSDSFELYKNR